MRRRTLKWILFLLLGSTAIYASYELHFKFVINDYQISRIEKQLVVNFSEHSGELLELVELTKNLKEFELSLSDEKQLFLNIENVDYENYEQLISIFIQGDSIGLYDMKLQLSDVEQVISNSVLFDTLDLPDWSVDYSGSRDSQVALTLLDNRGIEQTTSGLIIKKLEEANCIGISKINDEIKIRFKGHRFDNFNYVFLTNSSQRAASNELSDNFFWEHFESGFYCGWTNWGWI